MQQEHSQKEFIWHFGEMGSRWSVNRTIGLFLRALHRAGQPDHLCRRVSSRKPGHHPVQRAFRVSGDHR